VPSVRQALTLFRYPAYIGLDVHKETITVAVARAGREEPEFRKTTMGMDILRCRTPAMVRKEILMHLIVYNCIRLLMLNAAKESKVSQRRISFEASVQALRQWEPMLNRRGLDARERRRLMVLLREAIAVTIVLSRPGRSEPRCRKRRPKNFQLMTSPRHEMREVPHRGAKRANRP